MARPDPRFFATGEAMSAEAACEAAGLTLVRSGPLATHASALHDVEEGALLFAEKAKALAGAEGTPALVVTSPALAEAASEAFPDAGVATHDRPKAAFARLASRLHQSLLEAMPPLAGIAEDACIARTAEVAPSAVIGAGALIHDEAVIGPFVLIGAGVVVGPGTRIGSHASVTHAILGGSCVISAGVRIGEAGFGYAAGDGVEIGANSCVDRGALGDTVIGEGTKIDNMVQVAHNCRIGRHCLIASQTGLSGSCVIGDGVMMGGQVGMKDHLTIGDGAVLAAGSGFMRDVPPGQQWGGRPARPMREWMREVAALGRLAKGKDQ